MNNEIRQEAIKEIKDLAYKNYGNIYDILPEKFVPGITPITASGKCYGVQEFMALLDASLNISETITEGKRTHEFELNLARYLGVRHATMVNSGSSANLLAIMALTSPIFGERRLMPGDEVITCAVGFPTTVNPIIQAGCIPVFVDVVLGNYNTTPGMVEEAITEKTKAIMLAHTLGNPFRAEEIRRIADDNNLFLIEDACDCFGGSYGGEKIGTFGHVSTISLFPAHQISVGEGGVVFTNNPMINKVIRSFRDWGRDCWCIPSKDNTCGKRFEHQLGNLPKGYDHKYTYSHVGYNLKSTDLQASIGIEQLQKLDYFFSKRKENWEYLWERISIHDRYFILPTNYQKSEPSWFGFAISVKETAPFTRNDLVSYLEEHKIGTRMIFGGNITKQPAYKNIEYRKVGELKKSDFVMKNSFWIGVWPGLTKEMTQYQADTIDKFIEERCVITQE